MDTQLNFTPGQIAEADSLNLTLEQYTTLLGLLLDMNVRMQRMIDKIDESNSRMGAEMQKRQEQRKKVLGR